MRWEVVGTSNQNQNVHQSKGELSPERPADYKHIDTGLYSTVDKWQNIARINFTMNLLIFTVFQCTDKIPDTLCTQHKDT